jgi:hypothetical protein
MWLLITLGESLGGGHFYLAETRTFLLCVDTNFPPRPAGGIMSAFFDLSVSATRHPAHRAARLNFYNSVGAEQTGTPGTLYFAECTKVWRGLMVRLQAAAEENGSGPFFSQDGLAS